MVSASEGVVYYCTVILTALVFLTEASAITTNYEKTNQNKTDELRETSLQRARLATTRSRNVPKNQNHQDRGVTPILLNNNKLKSNANANANNLDAKSQLQPELLVSPANAATDTDIKDKGGGSGGNVNEDDDQKTLSQQVADGKYGLIQNEIFASKPSRPGIISYHVNSDVPADNADNYGGLEPDDIWLAENHLLVLAGNAFTGGLHQSQWKPIDNYEAPKRPVKIPTNPKIPPPFPVQLNENGPIEYVKSDHAPQLPFTPSFFNPLFAQYFYNNKTSQYVPPSLPSSSIYNKYPFSFAAQPQPSLLLQQQQHKPNNTPFQLPINKPSTVLEFVPPYQGENFTEMIDEDDPSLYYPPPYDFVYIADNTSKVPPGPLVPGIVLPPPPDFFAALTHATTTKDYTTGINSINNQKSSTISKANYPQKLAKQLHYSQNELEQKLLNYKRKPIIPEQPTDQETFVSYNDIINEVTYPYSKNDKITYSNVKVNKVSNDHIDDDWIPIPAPKPYYITGIDKPIKNNMLVMMDTIPAEKSPKPSYTYKKSPNSLEIISLDEMRIRNPKLTKYLDEYQSTTPISPQIVSTNPSNDQSNKIVTTTPISPVSTSYQSTKHATDTIKATYYFYEEPQFEDTIPVTDYPNRQSFSTVSSVTPTTSPLIALNNTPKPTPVHQVFPITDKYASEIAYNAAKESKKRKSTTPIIPIYYLAELDNLVDVEKPSINLPSRQVSKNIFYGTTPKPQYDNFNYNRPTSRPSQPIFEYNYIASDYSDTSTPPLPNYHQQNYPIHFDYNAFYNQLPLRYSDIFQNSPAPPAPAAVQFNKPIHTTVTPILDALLSYQKPKYTPFDSAYLSSANHHIHKNPWVPPNLSYYNQLPSSYPTENPFYAFFTKEDEDLIDDNTKKYFTIFGQKLKQNIESTSPISVQTATVASATLPTSTVKWNNKYRPASQSSATAANNYVEYSNRNKILPGNYQQHASYYTTSTATPYVAEYTTIKNHYNGDATTQQTAQKLPISLEGDVLVNYLTPVTENPDAEYITQHKISKHIRPIVVEDLPADLNERLKNIMNLKSFSSSSSSSANFDKQQHQAPHKKLPSSSQTSNKYRYVLIDSERDTVPNFYPSYNTINDDYDSYGDNGNNFVYNKHRPVDEHNVAGSYSSKTREITSKPAISLANDIRVNYNSNKLIKNPDAEYIQTSSEYTVREQDDDIDDYYHSGDSTEKRQKSSTKNAAIATRPGKPYSLENDILVNYKNKARLTQNPDAEYIGSSELGKASATKNSGNVIAYNYPGVEHGHFYFLPPQETHLSQIEDERYDFPSEVEKPSNNYYKRVPRKLNNDNNNNNNNNRKDVNNLNLSSNFNRNDAMKIR